MLNLVGTGNGHNAEDDVFLSDDEGHVNRGGTNPLRKRSLPFKDEEEEDEEGYKMTKLEKKPSKKVQKRVAAPKTVSFDLPKPFKLTKENIETRISEIQAKYPMEFLILKFKQASILLESKHEKEFLEVLVDPLIQSLKLEIEIHVR